MRKIAALLLFFIAAAAHAQGLYSTLTGRVTSAGKPLAGATVTVEAETLLRARSTTTDTLGRYWFGALPAGTYKVTFEREGMQTLVRSVEVHLIEPARSDADIAPSAEGEVVTQTALSRSLLESPQLTTNVTASLIEPLPTRRGVSGAALFSGGPFLADGSTHDGIFSYFVRDVPGEALQEATFIRSAVDAEYGHFIGGEFASVTRSGGNDFTASLRATWRRNTDERFDRLDSGRGEASVGGRIVRDAVWFFLAGDTDLRLGLAKVTAAPDARQTVIAEYEGAQLPHHRENRDFNDLLIDYTAVVTPSFVVDGRASNMGFYQYRTVRGYAFAAGHDLSFGAERLLHSTATFVNDRWLVSPRVIVNLGYRHDELAGSSPRLGVVFDPAGDGRNRFSASYARYSGLNLDDVLLPSSHTETTLAYARQLEANGFVRVAYVKDITPEEIRIDGAYRFLIATFGGAVSFRRLQENSGGTVWVQVEPPLLDQRVNVSLLERYMTSRTYTDLALNYGISRGRLQPFVKFEVLDIFAREVRGYRFGLGIRL